MQRKVNCFSWDELFSTTLLIKNEQKVSIMLGYCLLSSEKKLNIISR